VEIGDTIDTPQEDGSTGTQRQEPRSRRSSTRSSGNRPSGGAATLSSDVDVDETPPRTGRRRNGNGSKARRDGNGSRNGGGSGGDGTSQQELADLLLCLRDLRDGDFSVRLPGSDDPLLDDIASAFNGIAERNERLASEVVRVSTTIGREGQMNERASIGRATGGWATITSSINALITDLVSPTTEVARVLTAVAEGDLAQKMVLEIDGKMVQGEFLRIGTTVNTMVDQLSAFASEVTRVAREVGTEGRLGGQANVPGVAGTWKDLTDNVNFMASNLTGQVRNIADVTTAVARGDLSRKITADAKGEIL
jgi:HAMP domain-containing protein